MPSPYLEKILAPREKILHIQKQHWFLILQESLVAVMVMGAIFALQRIIKALQPGWPTWIIYLMMAFPLISIIRTTLRWRSVRVALTNRRILRLSGVYEKHIGEISLGMIETVKISQGIIESLLGFGDLIFIFKESGESFTFYKMQNPAAFKNILDSLPQMKENQSKMAHSDIADITKLLKELGELYQNGMISAQEYQTKKNNLLNHLQ